MPAQGDNNSARAPGLKPGPRMIGPHYKAVDPSTLVGVARDGQPGKQYQLTPATAEALRVLRAAGLAAGHNLLIVSGYRTPSHQTNLFRAAVAKYGSEAKARKWVAKFSEHSTGQTVDFALGIPNSSANAVAGRFAELPIWQWLAKTAPLYGWTPYTQEPWHWTYNPVPVDGLVA